MMDTNMTLVCENTVRKGRGQFEFGFVNIVFFFILYTDKFVTDVPLYGISVKDIFFKLL
jgi:hypothetical protein